MLTKINSNVNPKIPMHGYNYMYQFKHLGHDIFLVEASPSNRCCGKCRWKFYNKNGIVPKTNISLDKWNMEKPEEAHQKFISTVIQIE